MSSVLFDTTLTLPQAALTHELRTESTKYSPTSLEDGMKYFHLPAELLKMQVFNMVDMGAGQQRGDKNCLMGEGDDKELLISIEELEKKFKEIEGGSGAVKGAGTGAVGSTIGNSSSSNLNNSKTSSSTPHYQKISRPDVTWLRRTEYISSVKSNPTTTAAINTSTTSADNDDDVKSLLSAPVNFEQIVRQVSESFDEVKGGKHPIKQDQVELLQSYPIHVIGEDSSFVHCLFLGDNSANENSFLLNAHSHPHQNVSNLFNPAAGNSVYKFQGEFDVQKSETSKNFVLMLPTGSTDGSNSSSIAQISKINSTFSLRKRRSTNSAKEGSLLKQHKIIKITRK